MAVYDRLSADKKFPPESRKARRELKFGRYDYYVEDAAAPSDGQQQQPQDQQSKRSAADVDAIVERLRQDLRRDELRVPARQERHHHRTVSKTEAEEIFDRLRQCDYSRWPVESRVGRKNLGQNRYDFYRGPEAPPPEPSTRVSKEELDTIIQRLSTYDVNKTPPGSRALEIKLAK